jgi:hypothetical protein
VDREYLKSTANIPRQAWEPIAYLYSEADQAIARIKSKPCPQGLEWLVASIMKDWHQVLGWLDEILLESQGIDALRSWQLMTGLQAQNPAQRPAVAVMPDFPQPPPPGADKAKRGMLR